MKIFFGNYRQFYKVEVLVESIFEDFTQNEFSALDFKMFIILQSCLPEALHKYARVGKSSGYDFSVKINFLSNVFNIAHSDSV